MRDLLANEGVDGGLRRAFIVYMLGHHRPMHEVLAPGRKYIAASWPASKRGARTGPS
jgi:hypothetical protein